MVDWWPRAPYAWSLKGRFKAANSNQQYYPGHNCKHQRGTLGRSHHWLSKSANPLRRSTWAHHSQWHFSYELLPVSKQSDSFSCGVLSWDALRSFLLKNKPVLINPMIPMNVYIERIKIFLRLVEAFQPTLIFNRGYRATIVMPLRRTWILCHRLRNPSPTLMSLTYLTT